MLIIISGVDKVGKTTVAKEISNIYNIPYIKFDDPTIIKADDPLIWARDVIIFHESILRLLEKLYEQYLEVNATIDRFYPDEIVYSKVFRNVNLFERYKDIDARFARIRAMMIYVCPPDNNILQERWSEEKKINIEKVDEIVSVFNEFNNYTRLSVYRMPKNFLLSEIKNLVKGFVKSFVFGSNQKNESN